MSHEKTWLSLGAAELVVRTAGLRGECFDCDVLIVGSGYGGAVAAARMAGALVQEAGNQPRKARIWLLERGTEYLPGMFPSRFAELPGHVRFGMQDGLPARGRDEGLFDVRIGPDVSALVGNGLGGGSLINAGVMKRPAAHVFQSGWPAPISLKTMEPGFRAAEEMLAPRSVPPGMEFSKLATLDAVAGVRAERCPIAVHMGDAPVHTAAGVRMLPCTSCGDCMTGCNQGAKGSLDTNYLAWARARGVEMFCGGAVEYLGAAAAGEPWNVWWHYTERSRRPVHDPAFRIRARHVVLAAGSLGSTEILLRSRRRGLVVSHRLGESFSTNGDRITAGVGHAGRVGVVADQESDPAAMDMRPVGPTITGVVAVAARDQAPPFVVEEFAVPAALRHVFGEVVALLAGGRLAGGGPVVPGADTFAVTEQAIERISLFGMMGDDGADGNMRLPAMASDAKPAVEGGIRIDWGGLAGLPLFKGMDVWLKGKLAALTPPARPVLSGLLPGALTVHPLGGCRMGEDFDHGVVDDCGRVFAHGAGTHYGLAVLDGSVVTRALGINPALTIAALAERAVPGLVSAWKLQCSDQAPAASIWPPRSITRRRELPPGEILWSLRERLQGPFLHDGQTYWAQMDIVFDQVPGFRKALSLQTRVIGVRQATLTLRVAKAGADAFSIDESAAVCCRAELAGSVRLFMPLHEVPGKDDPRVTLTYQLSVQAVGYGTDTPLAVGGRIDGVKVFGKHPDQSELANPWRQLMEMDVRYDGVFVGRWALDTGDLAQRRDPLLRIARLSSMPDALGDLSAVALYVLRRALQTLLIAGGASHELRDHHLDERFPGLHEGTLPDILEGAVGARLSHYPMKSDAPPVLLVHGLGTSGASFSHPSIPHNLLTFLRADGRDVWILDVRSSVGNEKARHKPESTQWTVELVARTDIPWAVRHIYNHDKSGGPRPVDVVAHCMGAVMFCVAALGSDDLLDARDPERPASMVRAVVLSQVGPLLHLSPLNRLRGYVATYLQQYFRAEEFDTRPDFQSRIGRDGSVTWEPRRASGLKDQLLDAALATFAYPDDDDENRRAAAMPGSDFRRVRHRGDAIFGQLFELRNIADSTLSCLDALLGWVKVPMLAQAIHFARQNMLTDARGRNTVLHQKNFARRFAFPVLMVHGRRNRVFDWRGSRQSLELLKRLRGEAAAAPQDLPAAAAGAPLGVLYGADTPTQLAVFEGYGHLDCMIGAQAHADIFPLIQEFFSGARKLAAVGSAPVKIQAEAPWIGPMLGWLQRETADAQDWLRVKVLVHPQLRRAHTQGVAVVQTATVNGVRVLRVRSARQLAWPGDRYAALDLHISAAAMQRGKDSFALFTLHSDLPLMADAIAAPPAEALHVEVALHTELPAVVRDIPAPKPVWLAGSTPASQQTREALEHWLEEAGNAQLLPDCLFSLAPKVVAAADTGSPCEPGSDLCFALASCQYPPGLLDEAPAGAAYRRLQAEVESDGGPQFLMLAGDQVYVDAAAGLFDPVAAAPAKAALDANLDRIYELTWRLQPFRRTAARLPVCTMMDDHEVADNWPGLDCPSATRGDTVAASLAAYGRYQQALAPGRPLGGPGSRSYAFFPAGVPFFVLDTRSRRALRDALNVADAAIVQEEVMADLCRQLQGAPRNSVKFVVSPSPILPPEHFDAACVAQRLRSDTWSGYPASTSRLLRCIRDQDIRRVVLLAGDSHLSTVSTFAFEDTDNRLVSIVSSGLYTPWPFANQRSDQLVLRGRVDLGLPGEPCRGSMSVQAISASCGYAVIALTHAGTDSAVLRVGLRSASGPSIDCECVLG